MLWFRALCSNDGAGDPTLVKTQIIVMWNNEGKSFDSEIDVFNKTMQLDLKHIKTLKWM